MEVETHFIQEAKAANKPRSTLPRYLLSRASQQRLIGYEQLVAEAEPRSTHVFDLKHNAKFAKKTMEKVSGLVQGSELWNHRLQRGLLIPERLAMMGYTYPDVELDPKQVGCPFAGLALARADLRSTSLQTRDWARMVGQGLHVWVAGASLLWVLSHLKYKEEAPEDDP